MWCGRNLTSGRGEPASKDRHKLPERLVSAPLDTHVLSQLAENRRGRRHACFGKGQTKALFRSWWLR